MSVKLWLIVFMDFKHYPSTYYLMQGSCAICRNFEFFKMLPQSENHNL